MSDSERLDISEGLETSSGSSRKIKKDPKFKRILRSFVAPVLIMVLVVLAAVLSVRGFFPNSSDTDFFVQGRSMEPTLQNNTVISFTDKKEDSDSSTTPKLDEILTFTVPEKWSESLSGVYGKDSVFVKRVAANSGDKVYYNTDRKILVVLDQKNNVRKHLQMPEDYTCTSKSGDKRSGVLSGTVPKDSVFVLGDNHSHSLDSLNYLCTNGSMDDASVPNSSVLRHGNYVIKEESPIHKFLSHFQPKEN